MWTYIHKLIFAIFRSRFFLHLILLLVLLASNLLCVLVVGRYGLTLHVKLEKWKTSERVMFYFLLYLMSNLVDVIIMALFNSLDTYLVLGYFIFKTGISTYYSMNRFFDNKKQS